MFQKLAIPVRGLSSSINARTGTRVDSVFLLRFLATWNR
jgi:hypothetical protein